jgi:hypothetical protein
VIRALLEQKVEPVVGQRVLLYEKDIAPDNTEYYICNIGQIVEATANTLREYESRSIIISHQNLTYLGSKPVLVKIDRERSSFFSLPLNILKD